MLEEARVLRQLSRFEPTPSQMTYLDSMMNKVSRSFAVVVPCLEEPLNHYLSTAYLLCRVVDNIEDCTQSLAWKEQRFTEFSSLLNEPLRATEILSRWQRDSWPGLTADEAVNVGRGRPTFVANLCALSSQDPRYYCSLDGGNGQRHEPD
jgi:hypothetical protein